jgi:hypothetical protein
MPSEAELQAATRAILRDASAHVACSAARRLADVALDAAERIRNIERKDRRPRQLGGERS